MKTEFCISLFSDSVEGLEKRARRAFELGTDLVEFRLDMLEQKDSSSLFVLLKRYADKSIVKIKDLSELEFVKTVKPRYIDIPFELCLLSKLKTENTIFSWHDFRSTPKLQSILKVMERTPKHGIPKIVTMALNLEDNARILSLYKRTSRKIIAFCMGETGVVSRILSVALGAPIAYTCLPGERIADGQLDYKLMVKLCDLIK